MIVCDLCYDVPGVGFGLIYVPSVISIGFYFERWRSLATSIAACGAGFGTILNAPVMSYLLDTFGWRNTVLVQAGKQSCSTRSTVSLIQGAPFLTSDKKNLKINEVPSIFI